MVGNIPTQ